MIIFGISKKVQAIKKTDSEEFPVLTVLPRPIDATKVSFRMEINDYGLDFMSKQQYTFGQNVLEDGTTENCLIDLKHIPAGVDPNLKIEVKANGNVNNMKLWKHLRKLYDVPEETFRLKLEHDTVEGLAVLKMSVYNPDAEEVVFEIPEEMIVEEVPYSIDEQDEQIMQAEPAVTSDYLPF